MRALLERTSIVAIGVVTALCAMELAGRIYLRYVTVYDVEMSRYATELKVRSDDPRIGHVHRKNANARLMNVDVAINSAGLRDREYPVRSNKRRLVFLGDSLTFGWGVEKKHCFEELLEDALDRRRPTEVLNLGTGNYNTEQEVAFFIERADQLAPDAVVVFYFINDAEPTSTESDWGILSGSRAVTLMWSKARSLLHRFGRGASYRDYYAGLYRADQPGWKNARAAFSTLAEFARSREIELRVVLLPDFHELAAYPFAAEHRLVQEFLEHSAIDVLDLAPLLADETDSHRYWVAPDDAHPNAAGHALIAKHALDFVDGR